MPTLHGVLKAARRDAGNTRLAQHGWLDGSTRPPADSTEKANSLDWLGGGARTFSVPLEVVAAPGVIVAYAFIGWEITDRGALFRTVMGQSGWLVARLGSDTAATDVVWWFDSDADFARGLTLLAIPLRIQPVADLGP